MSKQSTNDDRAEAGTDSEEEPALHQKFKREFRVWQLLGQWDPSTDSEDFIETEIIHIAKEKMAVAGATQLSLSKFMKPIDPYGKLKDVRVSILRIVPQRKFRRL